MQAVRPYLTADIWSHIFSAAPAAHGRSTPNPTMARKKISTTIYITPEQNERLKMLNDRTKVPVAEYIRQGIDLVLDKYKGALPGQLSLEDLGPKR